MSPPCVPTPTQTEQHPAAVQSVRLKGRVRLKMIFIFVRQISAEPEWKSPNSRCNVTSVWRATDTKYTKHVELLQLHQYFILKYHSHHQYWNIVIFLPIRLTQFTEQHQIVTSLRVLWSRHIGRRYNLIYWLIGNEKHLMHSYKTKKWTQERLGNKQTENRVHESRASGYYSLEPWI